MLDLIKTLFAPAPPRRHEPHELHLAAGALLIEAALVDGHFDERERAAVAAALRGKFALSAAEVADLMTAAEQKVGESTQLFAFTRVIARHFSPEERIGLIEMLCEVIYADGVLHDHQASMLRQVGKLIGVSDRDRGDARKRVLARLDRAP